MGEKAVEAYGAKRAKELGIFVIKLRPVIGGGWPDHTFFKDGRVAFIEYKDSATSKYQPLQPYYLKLLQRLGFMTTTCWTNEQVDDFLEVFESEIRSARISRERAIRDDVEGVHGTPARPWDGKDGDLS
jgi:hypothetical protein